jgi:glycosyltransferase involved in cell wall biosynthesis
MKIIYDHQAFSFEEYGGISRYFSELMKCSSIDPSIEHKLLIKYSNNNYIPENVIVKRFSPKHRFKGRNRIIEYINRYYSKSSLNSDKDYDLFHPTYYDPYFLKAIDDTPFIITIHDFAHESFPGSFNKLDYTARYKKILALEADRIIAISEFTKNDIMKNYGVPESKIDVIYHASSISSINEQHPITKMNNVSTEYEVNKSLQLPENFILYIGKRNTYKNFPFFLKAFKEVLSQKNNYYVVCVGGGKFNRNEINLLEKLHLTDKIMQINADDKSLGYIYSKANVFVFPSLYEGFGIPVLEAFSCGCPAVLSNNTALPEVGGNAALYFDPENIDNLTMVLLKILGDPELRNKLKKEGIERAKLFSWEKTAKKTFEVYKKTIKQK